jgi:CRP/FNR family cyclic AMP-dependent transcriptional regulator
MADVKSVGLFSGLPDKELQRISKEVTEVNHPADKKVMITGSEGVGFMVVLDGELDVVVPSGTVYRLGPGDHFGEMALLDHLGRSADVITRTPVRLAAIAEWEFKPFLEAHPEIAYRLLQRMSVRLREARADHPDPGQRQ